VAPKGASITSLSSYRLSEVKTNTLCLPLLQPFQIILQGFSTVKKRVQGAAQGAQRVAKDTAKFVAEPVVHAAKTTAKAAKKTAKVAKGAGKKVKDGFNDMKRYVGVSCCCISQLVETDCILHLGIYILYCRREAQRQEDIKRAHTKPEFEISTPHQFCPNRITTDEDTITIITDTTPLDTCNHLFSADFQAQAHLTGMSMV
jgi:hypothetical protein